MSNALKCPNPSCPYLFDPSQVPAGAVLTCPRCGMRFTLGPPQPAAPPAYAPTQTMPAGYPPAGYGPTAPYPPAPGYPPPQPPAAGPVFADPPAAPGPDGQPGAKASVARRPLPTESGGNTLLLVVAGVALMAGVGLMVYFRLNPIRTGGGPVNPGEMKHWNLAFDPPPAPWVQDDDLRAELGSPYFLVYRRENPEAYMAFGARDYDTREARPSEIREGLMRPLNLLFEEVTTTPIEGAKWLALPAVAFEFRGLGKKSGTAMVGECHAAKAKGLGYWAVCWTGEGDAKAAFPEFDQTRNRFRLLNGRDNWAPKEGATRSFGGHKVNYQVLDGENLWAEPADPKANEFDPAGNLYLQAFEKKRKKVGIPPDAELVVLVLDPEGGDPLAQGVKYVKDKRTAEVEGGGSKVKVNFTDRSGPAEGDPANPIDPTAPVARFEEKVAGDRNQHRLRVVSALRIGNKVAVVNAWCSWEHHLVFEDRLIQIAGSLREGQ